MPDYFARVYIAPPLELIRDELKTFQKNHVSALPPMTAATIDTILNDKFERSFMSVFRLVVGLRSLRAQLELVFGFQGRATSLTERAFVHLQSLIIVDHDIQQKWDKAFQNGGEVACEKLGAVHLLWHGIWAFKADAKGAKTDLVLGERLSVDERVKSAAAALVLTEWKVVKNEDDTVKMACHGREQAAAYSDRSLAGFVLDSVRYVVLVSDRKLRNKPGTEFADDGVCYKYINIAVQPHSPSEEGRRASQSPHK